MTGKCGTTREGAEPFQLAHHGTAADIDVCICSYKRAEIVSTLAAIKKQTGIEGLNVRVIVADNTAGADSRSLILDAANRLGLQLTYVHAPASNIAIARNSCLENANAEWLAFIDDDEVPGTEWLKQLYDEAMQGGWDAVLGPVLAVYPEGAPQWMIQSDFHSTFPVRRGGLIETAYTGNILFRRRFVNDHVLRFQEELGRSGGEDEELFYRFYDAGGRIGYASEAAVYERVPIDRTRIRWLSRRNFRAGQSHGARLCRQRQRKLSYAALAAAKALYCGSAAMIYALDRAASLRYWLRACLHLGVVARLAGHPELQLY
jgi:succinoglycan biosynthesis protein ExoM